MQSQLIFGCPLSSSMKMSLVSLHLLSGCARMITALIIAASKLKIWLTDMCGFLVWSECWVDSGVVDSFGFSLWWSRAFLRPR